MLSTGIPTAQPEPAQSSLTFCLSLEVRADSSIQDGSMEEVLIKNK